MTFAYICFLCAFVYIIICHGLCFPWKRNSHLMSVYVHAQHSPQIMFMRFLHLLLKLKQLSPFYSLNQLHCVMVLNFMHCYFPCYLRHHPTATQGYLHAIHLTKPWHTPHLTFHLLPLSTSCQHYGSRTPHHRTLFYIRHGQSPKSFS